MFLTGEKREGDRIDCPEAVVSDAARSRWRGVSPQSAHPEAMNPWIFILSVDIQSVGNRFVKLLRLLTCLLLGSFYSLVITY